VGESRKEQQVKLPLTNSYPPAGIHITSAYTNISYKYFFKDCLFWDGSAFGSQRRLGCRRFVLRRGHIFSFLHGISWLKCKRLAPLQAGLLLPNQTKRYIHAAADHLIAFCQTQRDQVDLTAGMSRNLSRRVMIETGQRHRRFQEQVSKSSEGKPFFRKKHGMLPVGN